MAKRVEVVCHRCNGAGRTFRSDTSRFTDVCCACQGLRVFSAYPVEEVLFEGNLLPPHWWLHGTRFQRSPRFQDKKWNPLLKVGATVLIYDRSVRIVRTTKKWCIDRWDYKSRKWVRCRKKDGKIWRSQSFKRVLWTAEQVLKRVMGSIPTDGSKTFLAWATPQRAVLEKLPHPSAKFRLTRSLWDYATWMAEKRPGDLFRVRRIIGEKLKKAA